MGFVKLIPEEAKVSLNAQFTKEEILSALRQHWSIVDESLNKVITGIMEGEELPTGLNDALKTLVPKVQFLEAISQFRPISLCNTAYKVITKILVNKIRPFLDELISPSKQASSLEDKLLAML